MHSPETALVGPPQVRLLSSLATIKLVLGITDTSSDAFLTLAVQQVSSGIARHCNRSFALQQWTDTFRARSHHRSGLLSEPGPLQLANFPLVSVQSVTETIGTTATLLVAGTDYEFNGRLAEIWRLDSNLNRKRWRADQVVVVYTAGYAVTFDVTLPAQAGYYTYGPTGFVAGSGSGVPSFGTISSGNVPVNGVVTVPAGLTYFGINNTTGAPYTIELPQGVAENAPKLAIKDESNNAGIYPGQLVSAGGLIDGGFDPSQYMAVNGGVVTLQSLGSDNWSTL